MRSITDCLDCWATVQPDKKLFGFVGADGSERDEYTYIRFAGTTCRLADWLRHQELRRGDRVMLAYPPGLDMIVAFFACARAGIIAVPVARPPASEGSGRGGGGLARILTIAADCGARAILADRPPHPSALRATTGLRWLVTPEFEAAAIVEDLPGVGDEGARVERRTVGGSNGSFADTPSRVLFLQYTSGATGNPRGVIVSHQNIVANSKAILGQVPVGTKNNIMGVSWLPQHHDMGLIGYYLFPVMVGGTTIGMSPFDFLRRPALWLQTIARVRGTYASSPNFGFEHCLRPGKISDEELGDVDLSSLRWLMSGAEPVRPATRQRFIARFARFGLEPEVCVAAYGLAENTLAATHYGRRSLDLDAAELRGGHVLQAQTSDGAAVRIASCGAPLPGIQLRIVDPVARRTLGERSIGEVWLAGPSVCGGYWGVPAETCVTFGQRLAGDEESSLPLVRWLRTGDLGFLDDGEVFICGRSKDVIIIRGANYYPQDIEAAVEDVGDVRPGSAVAFSGDQGTLVVMVEAAAGRPMPDPVEISRTIQAHCQVLPESVLLVQPGSIVKTTSGKLARSPTRQRLADGDISVLLAWHPYPGPAGDCAVAELIARLDMLISYAGPEAETASLAEAGVDSLMLTELLLSLEGIARRRGLYGVANEFDLALLQRLSIARLRRLLDELQQGGARAVSALGDELRSFRDEAATRTARTMRTDATLELFFSETEVTPRSASEIRVADVLLTGATGFFGPFLLESLLRQTDWHFHVLVRAEGADHARHRLRAALTAAGRLSVAIASGFETRVECACGDIALPYWGLEPEIWHRLAGQVQGVIHNAAAVNWVANYEALQRANVGGTRTMLHFAQTGRRKRVHHISSTFIFGWTAQPMLLRVR